MYATSEFIGALNGVADMEQGSPKLVGLRDLIVGSGDGRNYQLHVRCRRNGTTKPHAHFFVMPSSASSCASSRVSAE